MHFTAQGEAVTRRTYDVIIIEMTKTKTLRGGDLRISWADLLALFRGRASSLWYDSSLAPEIDSTVLRVGETLHMRSWGCRF